MWHIYNSLGRLFLTFNGRQPFLLGNNMYRNACRKKEICACCGLICQSTSLIFSEGLNAFCLTLSYKQELFMRFFRVKQTVGKSIRDVNYLAF